ASLAAVAAVLLVYLTSSGIPSFITRYRLTSEERAAANLGGFSKWLEEARRSLDKEELLAAIRWMRGHGIAELKETRRTLAAAVGPGCAIPDTSPLRKAAVDESGETSVDAADLLGTNGERVQSKAARLLTLVNRFHAEITSWNQQVDRLLP